MVGRDELVGRSVGEFVLLEQIGQGGFATVYRCEQPLLGRQAVVKVLHHRLRADEVVIQRFLREAQLASRLDHPYAAHVYAFGAEQPDGLLWIAMEMVHGTPFDRWLRERGPLPVGELVPFFERLAEVVQTAHERGIVHRDLKPSNLMVIERAGRLLPKLLDLGIAKLLADEPALRGALWAPVGPAADRAAARAEPLSEVDTITADRRHLPSGPLEAALTGDAVIGSPPYMAPEQWTREPIGPAADLYALGVLAYEALVGRRPFSASALEDYAELHGRAAVPPLGAGFAPALDRFFERALAKRPQDRPASALELAAMLRAASGLAEDASEIPRLDRGIHDAWIADAPQPLAEAAAALDAARNLHQARDAARELLRGLLRYLAAVALAAHAQVRDDREDPDLTALLRALRQRDLDLGERVRLLRRLVRPFAERPAAHPMPALVELLALRGGDDGGGDGNGGGSGPDPLEAILRLEPVIEAPAGADEPLRGRLARLVDALSRLLHAASFVLAHPLIVVRESAAERWTGLVRRPRRPLASVREHALAEDQPALVDRDGRVAVLLWPLVQVLAPTPGAEPELFVLDGPGRNGARLVAAPAGFERHDPAIWDWLGEHVLGSIAGDAAAAADEAPPYLGLATFATADAERFVGRERETDAFVNRLRLGALQIVVGPSGAGKSSFVHAGVIPALRAGPRLVALRPGAAPVAALAARLRAAGLAGELRPLLEASPAAAAARIAEAAGEPGLVLVVDQLEELFTLCHDDAERARFAAALAQLSGSAEAPVRVICTVRDDFLMRVEALPALGRRLSAAVFLLGNPSRDDLVRTIVEPARRLGYELSDPELAPEMADAVSGRPGALALLSFTAARLWELRDRRFRQLTRKAYEGMGGVGGALGRHAEETLAALTADEQRLVRDAFRRLVTAEGTRAQLSPAELAQALGGERGPAVIDKLIAARLLVATDGEDGVRVELAHEALLAAWPRAQQWIREDADDTRMRDQLTSAARQWEDRRRPQGLLWRDDALAELERWRRRPEPRVLTAIEAAFADASRAAAARSRRGRRISVTAAFAVLAAMVVLLANLYLDGRRIAATRQRELADQLEEQGRVELLGGHSGAALRNLLAAVDHGAERDAALELMIGEALRAFDGQRGVLRGHDGVVHSVRPVPGSRLISAGSDGTARLWSSETGRQLQLIRGDALLRDAQVDATGTRILTAGEGGRFRLHALDGRLVGELSGPAQPYELLYPSFSPDGARVATVHGADRTVRIWSAADGRLVRALPVGIHGQRVVWRPDGAAFVLAGVGAELRDADTGALVSALEGHSGPVIAAAFTADGARLATGSLDRTASLWDARTGQLLHRLDGHGDALEHVAFDLAGAYLGTASRDGSARIWDVAAGRLRWVLDGQGAIVKIIAFDAGGQMAATGDEDGGIRLWQLPGGRPLARLEGHAAGIRALAFVDDELVSASADGTLRRWSVAPHATASLGSLASAPVTMEIAPDARRIIVGCQDGSVAIYGLDGRRLAALEGHRGAILTAVLDAAGGAVTAAEDGTVRLWRGSHEAARIEVANLSAAAVAATGDRLATGTERGRVALWDVRTRTAVWSFEIGDPIARFELSPRGDRLLAVTGAGALHLLDATRGERYASLPDREVLHATFGPRGELITASGDRARIYDPAGRLVHELRGHTGRVLSARFDADGARAVTAGVDGTVRLWNADRGTELRRFDGHRGAAADAQLDARGLLWSVGNDGTLRAWDPGSGRLLSTFVHHRGSSYGMQIAGNAAVIATWGSDGIVVREPSLGRIDLARARLVLAP